MHVVPAQGEDRPALEDFLRGWHSVRVARRGEVLVASDHPAFLARSGTEVVGVATYVIRGADCELLTLHAAERFQGTGTALLSAVHGIALRSGCTRLWVVTTNDNVDALRFYQRRGFRLVGLRAGGVDQSRAALKPEIPLAGSYGIPLRDELELELDLTS